jgi:hypothetical protein
MKNPKKAVFEKAASQADEFINTMTEGSEITIYFVQAKHIHKDNWVLIATTGIIEIANAIASFLANDAECDVEIIEKIATQAVPSN